MARPEFDADVERDALALFDAALDLAAPEREAWLAQHCAGNEALRDRVLALLRSDAASDLLGVETGPAAELPAQIGPYRLEELIGSGGMGSVYKASRNDGLFEQTVAIKFVRPLGGRIAVEALVDAERRALARLEHPGIARILDGGRTEQGLHYLVMEYVEGLAIDAHMARHALDACARITLLRDVCAAVSDAHRKLVLHCDLKPANVLVDDSGRARLIDFGIARLRGVIDPALPHGFTRGYASPQRSAGEAPTVADDVYALGVMLAELLGGQRPEDATALQPTGLLDAELAAVARRACAAAPAERYASAEVLADELQRWLDKRPVQAMPPHWRYRAAKLLQRHPWRVAAGAGALAGLLIALSLIATLYLRANAARREAEQRFEQVRSLANYMLGDLNASLEATPGSTAVRRELVERSQHYLDALAQTAGANLELQREVAVGLGRLAEIQGGWAVPNTGERQAARATFERAEGLLAALVAQHSERWPWRRDLARVQQRLADYYGGVDNDSRKQRDKAAQAEAHARQALQQAVAAGAAPRELGELQTVLSAARISQAFARDWLDDSAGALALALDEEARLAALDAPLRAAMEFEPRIGRAANQAGDSLFFLNRFDEALAAYRRAQQHYAQALQARPEDRRLIDSLAVSRWSSSLTLTELGRHAESLVDSELAMAQADRLIALDPGNDNAHRLRMILRSDRALVLGRLGRFAEAIELAQASLRERRERAERTPELAEPARDALVPLHALADLYWRQGDKAAACATARQAIAGWERYAKRWPLSELDRKQSEEKRIEAEQRCRA
ncbi:protein kinase [Piscinibacter sp.]|uniref:serine/threonine-protein kinase n=1 Tax=Piscinibacter sp. TaxID=1903157 RepID=UPI0011DBD7E8|nr:MAG: serine/threonine protein kinase [Burkholderiaceae bacterium]